MNAVTGLPMGVPMDVVFVVLAAVFGLLVGSFLNVVVYRLPKIMERQWAEECAEMVSAAVDKPNETTPPVVDRFNLMVPRSRCGHCGHAIRWFENIPLFSYVFLRGKCSACSTPSGVRYPLVELVTGAIAAYCALRWGQSASTVAWFAFGAALLTMALIDWTRRCCPTT